MPAVALHCPLCAGVIQIDSSLAGQQVACPLCQGLLAIPDESVLLGGGYSQPSYEQGGYQHGSYDPGYVPQSTDMPGDPYAQPAGDLMQLACPICGGGFQVSLEMAGQTVGCPHCQQAVQLPPLSGNDAAATGHEAVADDAASLLPPGMEAPPMPAPVSVAAPSSPPPNSPPPHDPRLPPERKKPTAERKAAKQAEPDRFPPGFAGGSTNPQSHERERQSPTRQAEKPTSPMKPTPPVGPREPAPNVAKPTVAASDEQKERERRQRRQRRKQEQQAAIDDLLPPGAAPAQALSEPKPRSTEHKQPAAKSEAPAPEPAIDSLLPPGKDDPNVMAHTAPTAAPVMPAAHRPTDDGVDQLLPPGDGGPAAAISAPTPSVAVDVVDTLLPHGAQAAAATGTTGQQVAIPKAPIRLPKAPTDLPPGAIAVPTPDGGFVTVKESATKTITSGNQAIELRKLSPEEKTKRRRRNNIVLFGFCLVTLVVVMLILMNM
jgi:hypothetical protein